MKINIESIRKKETANVIRFDYEIDYRNEKAVERECLALLNAEQIKLIRINGEALQENGFAVINYEIEAEFTAECARCGQETPQSITVCGKKYLADKTEDKDDNKEDSEDYYTLENPSIIDLYEFMTEFIALEVPLRYLCDEDCKGLCHKCGKDLNTGECGCPKKEKNPAFKALDDFFN
jgi:uncharacterized protein